MLVRAFQRVVLARRWLSFLVLCLSFLLFGTGTLNLLSMFRLNIDLIAENGSMALADGAGRQLFELLLSLLGSMGSYVVFKACEHSLVQGLTHIEHQTEQPAKKPAEKPAEKHAEQQTEPQTKKPTEVHNAKDTPE